jgi:ribosomal protein S18 acetylase RimI-like enzyme
MTRAGTQIESRIRRATLDDVPDIARVHVRAWRVAYRGQLPDSLLAAQSEDKRASLWRSLIEVPGHGVFVAVSGAVVAGFCDCIRSRDTDAAPDTGEIASIYVDPAHWRAGLGRELMAAGVEHARAAGYRALTLWVLASNAPARSFYERQGFRADGLSKVETRADHSMFELRYRRELALTPAG